MAGGMNIFTLFGSILVDSDKANESISKTEKKAEGLSSKLGGGIATAGKWGLAVGGAAIAVGGAMVGLSVNAADAMGEIDDAAQRAGTTAEEFQKYAYAAKLSGMETATLEKAMVKQQKAFADAKEGSKGMSEAYSRLGIDINSVGSSSEAFDLVVERLANMKDETQRNAIANDIFGKSYSELTPLLNQGADGINKLKNEAVELGGVMSNESVAAGAEFGDQLDKLKTAFGGVINKIGVELLPIINEVLTWVIAHMPEIQAVISTVFDVIGKVVTAAYDIFKTYFLPIIESVFDFIADNFPVMKETAGDVFGAISEYVKTLWTWFNDNLMPIIVAVYELWQEVFPTVRDIFAEVFGKIIELVKTWWSFVNDNVLPIIEKILSVVKDVIPKLTPIFTTVFETIGDIIGDIIETIKTFIDWVNKAVDAAKKFFTTKNDTESASPLHSGTTTGLDKYINGSHANGLEYVPYDGYLAELHRGERVLTAEENRQGGSTVNHTGVIRIEGVNSKEQMVEVYEFVVGELRRESR